MPKGGLALYRNKKENKFLAFRVLYEYGDSMFVGFDPDFAYRIENVDSWLREHFKNFSYKNEKDGVTRHYEYDKISDKQKDWLKKGGYKKINSSLYSARVVGNYAIFPIDTFVPKGLKYTQLPGGGGVFKVTRNIQDTGELLKNPVVVKALDKWGKDILKENALRKYVRNALDSKDKVSYTGIFFDDAVTKKLDDFVKIYDQADDMEKIQITKPEDLDKIEKFIALPPGWVKVDDYHITITHGELPVTHKLDLNKSVDNIKIVAIGMSDKAIALQVEMSYFSRGEIQHITLAYNKTEDASPKDSNDIKTWRPLKNPVEVSGIIRGVPTQEEPLDEEDKTWFKSPSISAVPAGLGSKFPKTKEEDEE